MTAQIIYADFRSKTYHRPETQNIYMAENKYGVRAFLILDAGAVELPNHQAAIDNLDLTNTRLKIVHERPNPKQLNG